MEISGKIKKIDETKTYGTGGFRKRELVVTTDEQYPQMLSIEFTQDKCELLDNYNVGEDVKVNINLRGREWINPEGEAKYFNSIQGWRIEKLEPGTSNEIPPIEAVDAFEPVDNITDEDPDDLPF